MRDDVVDSLLYVVKNDYNVRQPDIHNDNPVQKWLVFGDMHIPKQDTTAVRAMVEYAKDYRPDYIMNLGDYLDLEPISHWMKNKHLSLEGQRIAKDLAAASEMDRLLRDEIPSWRKKFITIGNHEKWADRYVEEHPSLSGFFDIYDFLRNGGWDIIEYGRRFSIGHLRAFHGYYTNKHHTVSTLGTLGVSCIYGHTHDRQEFTISHDDGEKSAQTIGCLCNFNPGYAHNKPKRWVHGFATVDVITETGEFFVDFIKIINGRLCRNGKIYGRK